MKIREEITCPLEVTHDIIKGKWKTVILYQLECLGRPSLSQLENGIKGITQKMLLQQLRELMAFGLVDKETFEGYPLRVEYFVTEGRGKKLMKALDIMQEVGYDYLNDRKNNENE